MCENNVQDAGEQSKQLLRVHPALDVVGSGYNVHSGWVTPLIGKLFLVLMNTQLLVTLNIFCLQDKTISP